MKSYVVHVYDESLVGGIKIDVDTTISMTICYSYGPFSRLSKFNFVIVLCISGLYYLAFSIVEFNSFLYFFITQFFSI